MTTKHTAGPWRYELEKGFCGDIIASNGKIIASFIDEPSADDARLIAAAPELLEALRSLSELYNSDDGCKSLPQYIAARVAIAKATGESV